MTIHRAFFPGGILRAFFLSATALLTPVLILAGIGGFLTGKESKTKENAQFLSAADAIAGSIEVFSLQNPLPQGYRVKISGENRFLTPEELIALLAEELPENWQEDEFTKTAVMMRLIAVHTKALGEMYDRVKGWDESRLMEESWIEVKNTEKEVEPALLDAAKAVSGYFLAVSEGEDTVLWRESGEISLETLIKRLKNGLNPGEIWKGYEEGCFLERAEKSVEKSDEKAG